MQFMPLLIYGERMANIAAAQDAEPIMHSVEFCA
jgi:hypothetical protein